MPRKGPTVGLDSGRRGTSQNDTYFLNVPPASDARRANHSETSNISDLPHSCAILERVMHPSNLDKNEGTQRVNLCIPRFERYHYQRLRINGGHRYPNRFRA